MFDFDDLEALSPTEPSHTESDAVVGERMQEAEDFWKAWRPEESCLPQLDHCLVKTIHKQPAALKAWIQFLLAAIDAAAPRDLVLQDKSEEQAAMPANRMWLRRAEAAPAGLDTELFQRAFTLGISLDVDVIETTRARTLEPRAIILLLGKGGGSIHELRPLISWYAEQAYCHVVATTLCGLEELRTQQIEDVLKKVDILRQETPRAKLVVHVFSNTGYYSWGQILRRWRAGMLPNPEELLHGVVYDSASDAAMAAVLPGEPQQKEAKPSYPLDVYVQFVVLACIGGLVQSFLPEAMPSLRLRGENQIPVVAFRWALAVKKAGSPDPVYGRGPEEWLELGQEEPRAIQRLLLFGYHDPVVRMAACERFKQWLEVHFQCSVDAHLFENTVHCKHFEQEAGKAYFEKLQHFLPAAQV